MLAGKLVSDMDANVVVDYAGKVDLSARQDTGCAEHLSCAPQQILASPVIVIKCCTLCKFKLHIVAGGLRNTEDEPDRRGRRRYCGECRSGWFSYLWTRSKVACAAFILGLVEPERLIASVGESFEELHVDDIYG